MLRMRSTSPPKSAWPGVSTMLMRMSRPPDFQWTEVHLARIVMPRSRSRSFESRTRSATCWLARNAPDLAQELIDQRRLAVIDMRDDRDVTEFHKILTKQLNGMAGRA